METKYIQVILPLRLEWEPCYSLPEDDIFPQEQKHILKIGSRIKVKFAGRNYIAVVSALNVTPDIDISRIESVLELNTGLESVSEEEIEFWRFIASYYLCTVGEVYKAAYPASRTSSEQTRLRVEERNKRLRNKEIELWKARINRLSARLAAKDKALDKRHREDIQARLIKERKAIAKELTEAQKRLLKLSESPHAAPPLQLHSYKQNQTLDEAFNLCKPVLLKSSERYEIYKNLVAETLSKGKNILLLVPEIALAKRLQSILEESFADTLKIHHSEETATQRRRVFETINSGKAYILLSTRSGIFLPFKNLGLIIIDSEQSPFHKQSDSSPRYNSRDAAVMLGKIHGAKVLLGSVSPSLESLLNVKTGKYSFVEDGSKNDCKEDGSIEDSSKQNGKKDVSKKEDGSKEKDKEECLKEDGIKKGFKEENKEDSEGGEKDNLKNIAVEPQIIDTAAEKRKNGMLGCLSRKLIQELSKGKVALIRGFEKMEELNATLQQVFPGDTDRFHIFSIFEASKSDLSGYDIIALLSADALFRSEDFRSDERAFQFLNFLKSECGRVIIQTSTPKHQVFSLKSAETLLAERRQFSLPPYTRLIDVLVPECDKFENLTQLLSRRLQKLGFAATDAIGRSDGKALIRITLNRDSQLSAKKEALRTAVEAFRTEHKLRSNISFDVDPY